METIHLSRIRLSSLENEEKTPSPVETPELLFFQKPRETKITWGVDAEFLNGYREDIWEYLLEQDTNKQKIYFQSPQLKFRGSLVQYLRDTCKKLNLHIATLHSAVALLDLFMDAHILRPDRLTYIALVCLSLAAKCESKYSQPTLRKLAKISGLEISGSVFRQLEWKVAEYVKWKLQMPTPVTFAGLLADLVVVKTDLTSRNPTFVKKFRSDSAKILDDYLDLTLSDVRLKVEDSVDVACACVASTRADIGLVPWPDWLAQTTCRKENAFGYIYHLLRKMMQIKKNGDSTAGDDRKSQPAPTANAERESSPVRADTVAAPCPVSTAEKTRTCCSLVTTNATIFPPPFGTKQTEDPGYTVNIEAKDMTRESENELRFKYTQSKFRVLCLSQAPKTTGIKRNHQAGSHHIDMKRLCMEPQPIANI